MKMRFFFLLVFAQILLFSGQLFAWGPQGHRIIGEIAFARMNSKTRSVLKKWLDPMPMDKASTWMDEIRTDRTYDYMKTWHYINTNKGGNYYPGDDPNIINALNKVIDELTRRTIKDKKQIKTDLLVLIHLTGDIHQPLHVGYGTDMGGNSISVSFLGKPSNLHKVWDDDIIQVSKITAKDCMNIKDAQIVYKEATMRPDVVDWMNQSRNLLPGVYDLKKGSIDKSYVSKNTYVIEKQLLLAGARLATLLDKLLATGY